MFGLLIYSYVFFNPAIVLVEADMLLTGYLCVKVSPFKSG